MADYAPTAQDFEEWDNEAAQSNEIERMSSEHPVLYNLSEKLSRHPKAASLVESLANSPVNQFGISAGTSIINALRNMGNLSPFKIRQDESGFPQVEGRTVDSEPIWPPFKRPATEPTSTSGQIGSILGDLTGSAIAFMAAPGSTGIPGALATGFAQGEGGFIQRLRDSLIGLALPGVLHGKEFAKKLIKAKGIGKEIGNLEHSKVASERDVFGKKEDLAKAINEELHPVLTGTKTLTQAIHKASGESDSASKMAIGSHLKQAEDAIVKKYNNLYEGFNSSKAGKTRVKDPVNIQSLEKEFGLSPDDFSPDTQKLISNMIGKTKETPASSIISSETMQPVNKANIEFEPAKPPKVAQYIDLWKQTRAEVSDLRHAQRMASTPEAKRAFRTKADSLERFSDSIHERTMKSLTKDEQKQYTAIQRGYLNERVPFLDKPLLRNATDKHPEVADKFFEKLNSLGTPELINTIKTAFPKLADAITRHDLRGITGLTHEKINDLLKGDFGKFISPETNKALTSLSQHKQAEQSLKQALSKVQTTEIGRKIRASDIDSVIKAHPKLSKPFKDVADQQQNLRDLKDALIDQGFKLKEVNEALKKYKSLGSLAKAGAVPVASYLGIKKNKAQNEGYQVQ